MATQDGAVREHQKMSKHFTNEQMDAMIKANKALLEGMRLRRLQELQTPMGRLLEFLFMLGISSAYNKNWYLNLKAYVYGRR